MSKPKLYQDHEFRSPDGRHFSLSVEQVGDEWVVMQRPVPFFEQDFPPTPVVGEPFRFEETAVDAANRFVVTGEMPARTKFAVRQLASGEWLVFNAIQAKYGLGIHKLGSPAPGYATGAQYGRHATEEEALDHARRLAHDCDGVVVTWRPPAKNPQFIDMPRKYPKKTSYDTVADAEADGWVHINPDKTLHHHKGHVIYVRDITPGRSFGYDLAIAVKGHDRLFERSQELWLNEHPDRGTSGAFTIGFRSGDVVDAIKAACRFIDRLVTDVR